MSYRELRNFLEILRSLGYPDKVSMEDFRIPNFLLVSKILLWLVKRYQPNLDIPDNITTCDDRIMFLKTIAQLMYYNARIKLNLKKIYRADGHAIKQLLKLATILKKSKFATYKTGGHRSSQIYQTNDKQFLEKIQNVRSLSTELTNLGNSLHQNLENEYENQQERLAAIANPHNMDEIKDAIQKKNQDTTDNIKTMEQDRNNLVRDEENLHKKKKHKINELERSTKRYQRLIGFRPAFMDEYDRREKQLQGLFTDYVAKYRNLEYLESELEKYRNKEKEEIEDRQKNMREIRDKLKESEEQTMMNAFHGASGVVNEDELESGRSGSDGSSRNISTPQTPVKNRTPGKRLPDGNESESDYESEGESDDEDLHTPDTSGRSRESQGQGQSPMTPVSGGGEHGSDYSDEGEYSDSGSEGGEDGESEYSDSGDEDEDIGIGVGDAIEGEDDDVGFDGDY